MVPISANCDAACQQNLFITRQVHIRLAEKAARVERILLALENIPEQQKQKMLAPTAQKIIQLRRTNEHTNSLARR